MALRVRQRIEGPLLRARDRIERTDGSALEIDSAVVTDGGADDHNAVEDGRRRSDGVVATVANADSLGEIDGSIDAEIFARLAGHRVQRDESRIERAGEDT